MFFCPCDSAFYLTVTYLCVFCLGFSGGAVYLYMSEMTSCGAKTGICAGAGCAAALALQYFLQLRFSFPVPLGILMLLSFCVLSYLLFTGAEEPAAADPPSDSR